MPYADPDKARRYKAEWAKRKYWENPSKARADKRKHPKVCEVCGVNYLARTKMSRGCSRSCSARLGHMEGRMHSFKGKTGNQSPNWKGGRKLHRGRNGQEYVQIWVPVGYPGRPKNGYMMEHRVVMQEHLDRPLERWEWVHHRNGIKTDNRIKNLEIVTHSKPAGEVTCPNCQTKFLIH